MASIFVQAWGIIAYKGLGLTKRRMRGGTAVVACISEACRGGAVVDRVLRHLAVDVAGADTETVWQCWCQASLPPGDIKKAHLHTPILLVLVDALCCSCG
jgi:hypothetical protein